MQNKLWTGMFSHAILCVGVLIIGFPIYMALIASTHTAQDMASWPIPLTPGKHFLDNYAAALGGAEKGMSVSRMLWISLISALCIAVGKIIISLMSAFALVYFNFRFKMAVFWGIFITLMLPVEVRIVPTFEVVANLGMLNSYSGLTIPLIASATATFLFRQFFKTIPNEIVEAAKVDGAGPIRFLLHILIPLSATSIAALFVIQFIYGWNQYLWPLLISTNEDMYPVVVGIKRMMPAGDSQTEWNIIMATAILAMTPPLLLVLFMQKWFVKGLVESEK